MRKRLMGRKVCGRITKKRKKFSKGRKVRYAGVIYRVDIFANYFWATGWKKN